MLAGIIARVLANLGIFLIAAIFVSIAEVGALCGTIIAIINKNLVGIGFYKLVRVPSIFGLLTSSVERGMILPMLS